MVNIDDDYYGGDRFETMFVHMFPNLKCGVFRANWLPITAHGRRNPRDSGL
jgi:hypothetical protein